MNIKNELKKLEELKAKREALKGAIASARDEAVRYTREISDARVAALVSPEENPANAVDARIKKLERELSRAKTDLEKFAPEVAALDNAIERLNNVILPLLHAERLSKQEAIRASYIADAKRLLGAVNAVAAISAEAMAKYRSACAEFPKDETCEGHDMIRQFAGLAEIWDPLWIDYGSGTRRDVVVNAIWHFDRSLVDLEDRVARLNRHSEEHQKKESERHERERQQRLQDAQQQHKKNAQHIPASAEIGKRYPVMP